MKQKYQMLIIIFILMLFSLINNYSASFIMGNYQSYFVKELIWYLVGFLLIFLMIKLNISLLYKYSFYFYLFGNFLLILALTIGPEINGSTSWLQIGPVSLQPSEFMKIFLVLFLYYISNKNKKIRDYQYILITLLIVLIPSILTFLEPDTGAVILYWIIYLGFLIHRKLNKWWYIISLTTVIFFSVTFMFIYYNYQDLFIDLFGTTFFYRMDRITDFYNRDGYQISRAIISIGSSGLFGHGIRTFPEYFPEAPTDFAFALLISNVGLIGMFIFLIVYFALLIKMINIMNSKNQGLILPILLLLFIQFSINVLMNIGLFPIIGITLPFISYGGSNLISYMVLMGLVIEHKRLKG